MASYHLLNIAKKHGFGRGAKELSRRQSKYLFCSVFIGLLKWVLEKGGFKRDSRHISRTLNILSMTEHKEALEKFAHSVLVVIDGYFSSGEERSVYNEESFQSFSSNVNGYLKWEKIGKSAKECPNLFYRIDIEKSLLQRKNGTNKSPCDLIHEAIKSIIPRS